MPKLLLTYITKIEKKDYTEIILVCRNPAGERYIIRVNDFRPYFYIPLNEMEKARDEKLIVEVKPVNMRSIDGVKLAKVTCKRAIDVPKVRKLFTRTYEADVPFVCRFLIDKNIKHGIIIPRVKPYISHEEVRGW